MANRLKCNLHSCGWISDVGVLYKGIWLPAELHDIQLAPWRGSRHTHMYSHICADTEGDGERGRAARDSYADYQDIGVHLSLTDTETDTLRSKHTTQVSYPILAL